MSYKPSDFFVGITDFFSVLLPGAIVAGIARPYVAGPLFGSDGLLPLGSTAERWLAFLLGAYLAGHILFLLGAPLDSLLYDPLRKRLVPVNRDRVWEQADMLKRRALRTRSSALNTYQWARATLQLRARDALAEVERHEAESKFFRSLAIAAYALLVLVSLERVTTLIPAVAGGAMLAYAWAALAMTTVLPVWLSGFLALRTRREKATKDAGGDVRALPELRFFWTGVVAILCLLLALLIVGRSWIALTLLVILAACVWRYAERRWKSNNTAYQYAIVLLNQHQPSPPSVRREQAGAIAVRGVHDTPRVLLVRARRAPGQWIFPKGHIEPGETAPAAALRELREETGFDGEIVRAAGSSELVTGGEWVHVEYFLVEVSERAARWETREDREVQWATYEEALDALTFDDARRLLLGAFTDTGGIGGNREPDQSLTS